MIRVALPFLLILVITVSCLDKEARAKYTAQKYCGSCHAYPDPQLLPKKIWEKNVLPQMAFRMGLEYFLINQVPAEDQNVVFSTLPPKALVTREEWEVIKEYYLKNAPDSLITNRVEIRDTLKQFEEKKFRFADKHSMITMLSYDSGKQTLFAGTRHGKLWQLHLRDSSKSAVELQSPVSFYNRKGDKTYLSLMGIMDPNDQKKGSIRLWQKEKVTTTLLDSLKRPVYFSIADLNNDKLDDFVVCEFGNYAGELAAFKNLGEENYEKYSLLPMPGARKTEVIDWNHDGRDDIVVLMTQGDERILLLKNTGDFHFSPVTLARFPSVFGSSYFEIQDLNKDGSPDIIYSNGDNGDYSMILKPYHGIRTLMNDGHGELKESWFYPMHGASQFRAADFDQDGDVDIAAISFFPDFKKSPENAFIYFENKGSKFEPRIIRESQAGRWLTMECADLNQDGFPDIILGALNFSEGVPSDLSQKWTEHPVDLLVLKNKGRK